MIFVIGISHRYAMVFLLGNSVTIIVKLHENMQEKITLRPLARLMARKGRSTRKTRRIFTADIALDLVERYLRWHQVPGKKRRQKIE